MAPYNPESNLMHKSLAPTLALCALALQSSGASAQTLDKVKASGTITVAYRESSIPFSYLDD